MEPKVHRYRARRDTQHTVARWGWSLAAALGSALRGSCEAVCEQVVRMTEAHKSVNPSRHAVAVGVLHGASVFANVSGIPGLASLWNLGVHAATAGLAAHAVSTVAREYGIESMFDVPVLTATMRRMRSVTGSVPTSGIVLELYCEIAEPNGAPEGPLTDMVIEAASSTLQKYISRWISHALPGVGNALRWLNAGTRALQSAAYVSAMEVQAREVCVAMTRARAVPSRPRQAPPFDAGPWTAPLAA
jgi:hypothetical protein